MLTTWSGEERAAQHFGPRADLRIENGNDVQRDEQRRHEYAHRPFVRGQLDVEIRQAKQPDECRERRRGADERRVSDLDGLHADEKRVEEDAAGQAAR